MKATPAATDVTPTVSLAASLPTLVAENARLRRIIADLLAHGAGVVAVWEGIDDDLGDLDDAIGHLSDTLTAASNDLPAPSQWARTV